MANRREAVSIASAAAVLQVTSGRVHQLRHEGVLTGPPVPAGRMRHARGSGAIWAHSLAAELRRRGLDAVPGGVQPEEVLRQGERTAELVRRLAAAQRDLRQLSRELEALRRRSLDQASRLGAVLDQFDPGR